MAQQAAILHRHVLGNQRKIGDLIEPGLLHRPEFDQGQMHAHAHVMAMAEFQMARAIDRAARFVAAGLFIASGLSIRIASRRAS